MIGINPFEGLWANFLEGEQEEFRKLQQLAPGYRQAAWTLGLKRLGIDNEVLGAELAGSSQPNAANGRTSMKKPSPFWTS